MFNEYVTFGESLLISLFCMVIVFIALYAISYIVDVTRIFVVRKQKKDLIKDLGLDASVASSIGIIGSPDGPTATFISDTIKKGKEDAELVAVITAAIAAMTGTDASGFVIKNIRKLSDADTAWSRIGRIELMR